MLVTNSEVAALPNYAATRMLVSLKDRAQGHLDSEGQGRIPGAERDPPLPD